MARNCTREEAQELLVACGGRCTLCNKDVMHDYRTGKNIRTFEKAHIWSYSNNHKVRINSTMSEAEKNAIQNIMVLCPACHSTVDNKLAEGSYTPEWLLKLKKEKESKIKKMLENINDLKCLFVKFSSPIGRESIVLVEREMKQIAFDNGFFSEEDFINICENANEEDITRTKKFIDETFAKRIQVRLDNGNNETICLFGLSSIPALVYLGTKFNDKQNIIVFTKHRDVPWVLDDRKKMKVNFSLEESKKKIKGNKVALIINTTATVAQNRVTDILGENVDIWTISCNDIKPDGIKRQDELSEFGNLIIVTIDKIGQEYGKDVEINIFPAICNSLAITLGRSKLKKSQNTLNIYDRDGEKDVLKLSI